jgi:hypothetical protein
MVFFVLTHTLVHMGHMNKPMRKKQTSLIYFIYHIMYLHVTNEI